MTLPIVLDQTFILCLFANLFCCQKYSAPLFRVLHLLHPACMWWMVAEVFIPSCISDVCQCNQYSLAVMTLPHSLDQTIILCCRLFAKLSWCSAIARSWLAASCNMGFMVAVMLVPSCISELWQCSKYSLAVMTLPDRLDQTVILFCRLFPSLSWCWDDSVALFCILGLLHLAVCDWWSQKCWFRLAYRMYGNTINICLRSWHWLPHAVGPIYGFFPAMSMNSCMC